MKRIPKKALLYAMVVCLILLTAACGGGNSGGSASSPAAGGNSAEPNASKPADSASAKGGTTISYMVTTENLTDRLKAIIANYEQKSGNKVDVQSYPATEFENILKVKMMSGEGPDLFTTDDIIAAQFMVPRDWFEDLSNRPWVSRLSQAGKSMLSWNDGKITGLPITNPSGFGIMYNKDIFAKVGITEVPKTWKEFLDVSEKIKKAGITPVNIQLANGSEFGTTHMMHQLFANVNLTRDNPSQFFKDLGEHKIKLSEVAEYEQALNQMVELKDKGYINEDFISNTFDMTQEKFGTGVVAMHPCGDFILGPMLSKYPNLKVGFFPLPFGDTEGTIATYSGVGISVNSKAKNKDAALDFIDFFTSKEQQEQFMKAGPGTNVFSDVKAEPNMISQDLQKYMDAGKAFPGLFNVMEAWPEMDSRKIIQEVMLGSKTPKQMLDELDKKAEVIAKGKNLAGW